MCICIYAHAQSCSRGKEGILGPERPTTERPLEPGPCSSLPLSGFRTPCTCNFPFLGHLEMKRPLLTLIISTKHLSPEKAMGLILHTPQHLAQSEAGWGPTACRDAGAPHQHGRLLPTHRHAEGKETARKTFGGVRVPRRTPAATRMTWRTHAAAKTSRREQRRPVSQPSYSPDVNFALSPQSCDHITALLPLLV